MAINAVHVRIVEINNNKLTLYIMILNVQCPILNLIAPLSDIPMHYTKDLTLYRVHIRAGAIKKLMYGCAFVREIIHELKLVDYLPVHTHNTQVSAKFLKLNLQFDGL